jgi:energy-coupling factor transporter ATP-binding protein EcfA2
VDSEIIVNHNKFLRDFVNWIHNRIKDKDIDEFERFLYDDLIFFYKSKNYEYYIKSLINYSNIDIKNKYTSCKNLFLKISNNNNYINDNFKRHKNSLFERITKSEWFEKYVDLHIKKFHINLNQSCKDTDLMQTGVFYNVLELKDLIKENENILLLGNPGSGKTTALLNLTLSYLYNEDYVPVYLELNGYNEETLKDFIYNCTNINIDTDDNTKYIFFFDGLNELSVKNSKFYNYINRISNEFVNHKIVVSCRLNSYSRKLNNFDTYVVLPMSQTDVIDYLDIAFHGRGREIYNDLNLNLKELSATPLLLTMFERVLSQLDFVPNNIVELYQGFIEYLLFYWETTRESAFTLFDKITALKEIASFMYLKKGTNHCTIEEFQKNIYKAIENLGYDKSFQNKMYEELLSDGIIQQKAYVYPPSISFSHESMLEFFFSKSITEDFENENYKIFENRVLDINILMFLKDLILDKEKLLLILNDREIVKKKNYLQSNIISILHLKGFSFEGYDLSNLYFPRAKLHNASFFRANLSNSVFKNSNLNGVNLTDANLTNTDLSHCNLSGISFLRCSIRSICILEDYNRIAYVGDSTNIKIWDRNLNKQIVLEKSHTKRIRKVAYSKIKKYVAASGYDNNISMWNDEGKLLKKLNYHNNPVLALQFSPDGKYLISGDSIGKIIVYCIDNDRVEQVFEELNDNVREIIFIDKFRFISACWDSSVVLWSLTQLSFKTNSTSIIA